jgi:hypothetical protein
VLPGVMAFNLLHDPVAGGELDAEHVFNLALSAGYTREQAGKVAQARALDRLRRDLPA